MKSTLENKRGTIIIKGEPSPLQEISLYKIVKTNKKCLMLTLVKKIFYTDQQAKDKFVINITQDMTGKLE